MLYIATLFFLERDRQSWVPVIALPMCNKKNALLDL
jgi:hypothetical protein